MMENQNQKAGLVREIPLLSIIVCSADEKKLSSCLAALKSQNYPQDKIEYLIMRGYVPEGKAGGKQVACQKAAGEFIAIVDEDNEVCGSEWLNDMLKPFEDSRVSGVACRLFTDHEDKLINQYISLIGTDPFMYYRSLDGHMESIYRKRIYGGLNTSNLYTHNNDEIYKGNVFTRSLNTSTLYVVDKGDYYLIDMNKKPLITGGNCFIYRKSALDKIGGYTTDADNIVSWAEKGMCYIAVPKKARTHHMAADSAWSFLKKKARWSREPISKKFDFIPNSFAGRMEMIWHICCNLTVVPNVFISAWNIINEGEPAWALHPLLSFATTVIYGWNFIKGKIFKG